MASGQAGVLRQLQTLFGVGTLGGMTDAELLEQFLARHGEAAEVAFEALVRRHGPMVLRVCEDVLGDSHAAEDAYQASFLVLARKASRIGSRELLGSWLYGVAYRTALKARTGARRRRRHEQRAAELAPEAHVEDRDRHDLAPLLHEEVNRLPERYRAPLVLCHLEGASYGAAARHLRVTEGTVRGRLARARGLLRDRLDRRGVALAIGLGVMASSRRAMAVPARLAGATTRAAMRIKAGEAAAAGAVPAAVATLMQEVSRAMVMTKMKGMAAGLLIAGLVSGAGWLAHRALADDPQAPPRGPRPGTIAGADDRAGEDDRRAIQGAWTTEASVTRVVDGKPQPPLTLEETWTITPETIATSLGERAIEEGIPPEMAFGYTLEPSKTPKEIDLTAPGVGMLRGIYSLGGDGLTICYGIERPTEFVNDEQGGTFLRVLKRVGRDPGPVKAMFANAPGCSWAVQPSSPGGLTGTRGGVVLLSEEAPDGALLVTLAHPVVPGPGPSPGYRPVAFDAAHKRHLSELTLGGTGGDPSRGALVSMRRYRLDPGVLPADRVTHLAVEVVPPEARRGESAEALEQAEVAGVEVLPPPRVGEPFEFALTTKDGKALRSEDLRGKVVLIDCWASWCSPCMAKMPALKALYEGRRDEGLEVVGICFDEDAAKANGAIASLGLAWPQVLVPDDEEVRRLWSEGSMIDGLPRLLVLDRRGILRADCGPQEVEEHVVRLLGASGDE